MKIELYVCVTLQLECAHDGFIRRETAFKKQLLVCCPKILAQDREELTQKRKHVVNIVRSCVSVLTGKWA